MRERTRLTELQLAIAQIFRALYHCEQPPPPKRITDVLKKLDREPLHPPERNYRKTTERGARGETSRKRR